MKLKSITGRSFLGALLKEMAANSQSAIQFLTCNECDETLAEVGRPPRSAADAPVGLVVSLLSSYSGTKGSRADLGVRPTEPAPATASSEPSGPARRNTRGCRGREYTSCR